MGHKKTSKKHGKKHHMRRNAVMVFGADVVRTMLIPGFLAGAGFIASRIAGNALSKFELARKLGGWERLAGPVIVAGAAGLAPRMLPFAGRPDVRLPVLIGAGLGAIDVAFGQLAPTFVGGLLAPPTPAPGGTAGLGRWVGIENAGAPYGTMMGEYVSEPVLGAYVSEDVDARIGEYVQDGGYLEGADPADHDNVDRLLDVAEAQAGVGANVYEAAAGMGANVYEAAAGMQGLGQTLTRDYLIDGLGAAPVAQAIRRMPKVNTELAPMPMRQIPGGGGDLMRIGPRKGGGYAHGIFSATVFDGMMAG